MSVVYPTVEIEVQLSAGVWTDISADVLSAPGITLRYGIDGNGPLDRVAGTGELQFTLKNHTGNTGGVQGYYSPAHPSKRTGWTFGIPCRVKLTSGATVDKVKFYGKIRVIEPEPGRYRSQSVRVTAYDYMRDIAEADARGVSIQVAQDEDNLLTALIDAMPTDAQPPARSFNAGVDSFPYAFHNIGAGTKVLAAARDVVISAIGRLYQIGDGTLKYQSRTTLSAASSEYTIDDSVLASLSVPSSLDKWFNRVRVTNHPLAVSAAATDELYTLPTGTSIEIPSSSTVELWTEYADPDDRQTLIGGTAVVTTLVANTHYTANSAADGSGSNQNANLTPTLTAFASTGKWSLQNTSGSPIFVTMLKVIGKAVRDPGPQTFESYEASDYGDRPVEIDLPYQDDPTVAQGAADYIRNSYGTFGQQIEAVDFLANRSATVMLQALTREPGDVVTVTEPVTGISGVTSVIQSVELRIGAGGVMMCRWGLAPVATGLTPWQLGRAGYSELGETTRLGF